MLCLWLPARQLTKAWLIVTDYSVIVGDKPIQTLTTNGSVSLLGYALAGVGASSVVGQQAFVFGVSEECKQTNGAFLPTLHYSINPSHHTEASSV